jgi:hypothetical protein
MSESKVVIENRTLSGLLRGNHMQRVAKVYSSGGYTYSVLAPPGAIGNAEDWVNQFSVRRPDAYGDEIEVEGSERWPILKLVEEKLPKVDLYAAMARGEHPDGEHCWAQICRRGHVQRADGSPIKEGEHCSKCGSVCVNKCDHCGAPIRGKLKYRSDHYQLPLHCHGCGRAYPWMQDRLETARELLEHDDRLSLDERNQLWGLLQYVMSDPKADLVPAKRKLIEIKLGKAAQATREVLLDFLAKVAAESLKG